MIQVYDGDGTVYRRKPARYRVSCGILNTPMQAVTRTYRSARRAVEHAAGMMALSWEQVYVLKRNKTRSRMTRKEARALAVKRAQAMLEALEAGAPRRRVYLGARVWLHVTRVEP